MTDYAETDTYFRMQKLYADGGGVYMLGLADTDSTNPVGVYIRGATVDAADTTTTAASRCIIEMSSGVFDAGSSITNVAASGNLFGIRNLSTTRWLIQGDGDVYMDSTDNESDWDEFDDLKLITGLRASVQPEGGQLRERFGEWIDYAKPILEETGVMKYNEDGSIFMWDQGMHMLTIDTIRQLYDRMKRYETALLDMGCKPELLT